MRQGCCYTEYRHRCDDRSNYITPTTIFSSTALPLVWYCLIVRYFSAVHFNCRTKESCFFMFCFFCWRIFLTSLWYKMSTSILLFALFNWSCILQPKASDLYCAEPCLFLWGTKRNKYWSCIYIRSSLWGRTVYTDIPFVLYPYVTFIHHRFGAADLGGLFVSLQRAGIWYSKDKRWTYPCNLPYTLQWRGAVQWEKRIRW